MIYLLKNRFYVVNFDIFKVDLYDYIYFKALNCRRLFSNLSTLCAHFLFYLGLGEYMARIVHDWSITGVV